MRALSVVSFALLFLTAGLCLAGEDAMTGEASHQSDRPDATIVHEHPQHEDMEGESHPDQEIGVDEHLGDKVPLDVLLVDEEGRHLRLGESITKPTLLLPVYYSCPATCSMMLANLAQAGPLLQRHR